MKKNYRILILEDSVDDVELIEHHLKKGEFSFSSVVVENREDYEKALRELKPDVVLSDHSMPVFDSMQALQMFHSYRKIFNPSAAFILVTGTVSEEFAVRIMKNGADDYILKDRLTRLPAAVQNAIEKNRLKDQRRREEEEKLYLFDILQRSLHEIYLIDPVDFKFVYANQEALNNLDYSLKELREMTPSLILDSFDEYRFREALKHAQERSKGLLLERIAKRKDGSNYPVQIHLQVLGRGERKKILANVIDITESKEQEQQKELALFIQNSFNHTRNLQESLEVVLERICNVCSCKAMEIYSQDFNQNGSKFLASHNPFNCGGSATGKLLAQKVYKSGAIERESKELGKNEEEKWLENASISEVIGIPIYLGEELIAVIVGYMDYEPCCYKKFTILSEQVQYKLAGNIKRKTTEEELQKIFDFSPDILMILGKDGYVRKVNPALQRILGFSSEEMLAKSYDHLLHPEDRYVLEKWRKEKSKENEVLHYESRWITSTGDYKWFSWSVTPYINEELHFAVGRDITESKNQLVAITEQSKKLAEIAWEHSHIVRAPLTRLLACVEYIQEKQDDPNDFLSSIKSSAHELDDIIRAIIKKSEKVDLSRSCKKKL